MKALIKEIRPHVKLYRDSKSGIAFVEDGITGCGHSAHPNIDNSGSVSGMKKQGYWDKNAKTVKARGFIYNISSVVTTDELDEIARQYCQCGGVH